ncbi:MAG: DUF4384 domain-containing protein [Gemmatimonadales bacterium]
MSVTLGWLLIVSLAHPAPASVSLQQPQPRRHSDAPGRISVWTDRENPYRRGEGARVYFRSDEPSYVTVLKVDTDGRIRALFPLQPWGRARVRGGRTEELSDSRNGRGVIIDDDPGVGYLFAISSPIPFQYEDITRGDYWDFRVIDGGRIQSDPYVALTALAGRIAPRDDYEYDIVPYYVERRYEYPRFVCYDCHSYASYQEWDPYTASCARFRVVVYDDPAYYPYRYNPGRNVVMTRPHPAAKYVFKDAEPGAEYVTRLRQRNRERPEPRNERGRTSADVGGPGAIPAPGVRRPQPRAAAEAAEPENFRRRDIPEPVTPPPPAPDRVEGRRSRPRAAETPRVRPADREPRKVPPIQRGARDPQSTGEPELRRRKP